MGVAGWTRGTDRRLIRTPGSRFEPLPKDAEAHDVESEGRYALRVRAREVPWFSGGRIELEGGMLIDSVHPVEDHDRSVGVTKVRSAGGPDGA